MPIVLLRDCPDFLPQVARWIWDEWRHLLTQESLAEFESWFRLGGRGDGLPTTLVWIEAGTPVATVSLENDDMELRPDLSPWLASLYVTPAWRGRGLGRALVAAAENAAREREVRELFLYTPAQESFYGALGWEVLERCDFRAQPVTVMRRQLQ